MAIITSPDVPLLQKDLIDDGQGYYPSKKGFDVSGHATTVNNTRVDVTNIGAASAAATYVFPASPIQMAVVSSSANDAAAGTGIRTVEIHYLDTNYAEQVEVVTLNGVTPVNTVATNILRVNDFYAKTVGSGGLAAGNVTLTSVGGAVIYARIETSFNRQMNAVWTVPAGKTGYLTHWNVSEGTSSGAHYTRFFITLTAQDGVYNSGVFTCHDQSGAENATVNTYYDIPIYLPAKTDVKVSCISDAAAANAEVTAHFSGWYE